VHFIPVLTLQLQNTVVQVFVPLLCRLAVCIVLVQKLSLLMHVPTDVPGFSAMVGVRVLVAVAPLARLMRAGTMVGLSWMPNWMDGSR